MPRADPIQTNFTAGEISPRLRGRSDTIKFKNGAGKILNFIVKAQGGAFHRTGTVFLGEVQFHQWYTKIIEFEYSDIQAYILEFGHHYIRIYKDRAKLYNGDNLIEIVTPYDAEDLRYLFYSQSADVLYLTHPGYPPAKLMRYSEIDWQYQVIDFVDGPYMSIDRRGIEMRLSSVTDRAKITTDVDTFDAGDVTKYVQYMIDGREYVGRIVQFVDAKHVWVDPQDSIVDDVDSRAVLTYGGGVITSTVAVFNNTIIGAFIKAQDVWYYIDDYTDETHIDATMLDMVFSAGSEFVFSDRSITAECTAVGGDVFVSTDVGRYIRFNFSAQQVWGWITSYVSVTHVHLALDRDIPFNPKFYGGYLQYGRTTIWRLGAWSETTGYPAVVGFHEERLSFFCSPTEPQNGWMSKSGDYENMAPTELDSQVLDDDAITFTVSSSKANPIRWMVSGPSMITGTLGSVWQMRASTINEPITPSNRTIQEHIPYGCANVRPVKVGSQIIYVQRLGKKLREISYDFQTDSLVAVDLSIISEHLPRIHGGITGLAFQQDPDNILWACCADGYLLGLTYVRDQEVFAWHEHVLGGDYQGGHPFVESIACIPSPGDGADQLYMVVKRTIGAQDRRFVEVLDLEYQPESNTDVDNFHFLDCGMKYDGIPTSYIGGFWHLEGVTVSIVAEGAYIGTAVVNGGAVSIPQTIPQIPGIPNQGQYHKFSIGLQRNADLELLPLEGGNPQGTSQGKISRIVATSLRLHESTGGFLTGQDYQHLHRYSFRETGEAMDKPPRLYTEDIRIPIDSSYSRQSYLVIRQDRPYPLNILAAMPEYQINPS